MVNVILDDRYMDCPTEGCPRRIVKVLVCSGKQNLMHKGLPFRSCNACGYYAMLDEYEAAAAGFCFSAANERAGHVLQEQIHTNAIEALLFATPPENRYNGPLAGHTFPLTSQAFPSTSRAAGASKPRCSIPGCKRKPAIECTLCKGCCERRGSGCSSTKHRSGPPRTKKVSSFVPDRPSAASPAFPATTNTSPAPSSALSPAGVPAEPLPTSPNTPMIGPRSFREDMPKEWGKEWNVRAKEVDERRAAAELRRRNEVAMARQVIIQLWRQDGSSPTMLREQNIKTYPTLNIAQCPSLMAKMGINAGAAVEIWNPRSKVWVVEDVDHSMPIKGIPQLLVRFLGVVNCPGFPHLIGEDDDEGPVNTLKRRFDCVGDSHLEPVPRHYEDPTWQTLLTTSSSQHSTQASDTSSAMMPSPLTSLPPSPIFSDFSLLPDVEMSDISPPTSGSDEPQSYGTLFDLDALWKQGCVHVPDNKMWPDGMYARDMAWGFTEMRKSRQDVEARFHSVFPGARWVKATYYRQLDAFIGSTVKEIDQCRNLGRSPTGLWTTWRGNSSGWAKVVEGRKAKASGRK